METTVTVSQMRHELNSITLFKFFASCSKYGFHTYNKYM